MPGQVQVEGLQHAPVRERQHEPRGERPEQRHGGELRGRAAPRGRCAASRSATPPRVPQAGQARQQRRPRCGARARSRARRRRAPTTREDRDGEQREAPRDGGVAAAARRPRAAARRSRRGRRRARRRPSRAPAVRRRPDSRREREHAHELAGAHRQHVVGEQADLRGPERRHGAPAATRAGRARASARSASRRRRIETTDGGEDPARAARAPIALRTSWKLRPRMASQPKTTETAMPTTAASSAPHALPVPEAVLDERVHAPGSRRAR